MFEEAQELLWALSDAPDQTIDPTSPRFYSKKAIDILLMIGYVEQCDNIIGNLKLTEMGNQWIQGNREGNER